MWKVIGMLSICGIYTSLVSLCLSLSWSWHAPMGATTLYVVLLLISLKTRIYKEEEPPLPATRATYSAILVLAMFYFPYYYSTVHVLAYVCSLFALGIAIFQLNSPMDTGHSLFTFFCGLLSALVGFLLGGFHASQRSFSWLVIVAYISKNFMFNINGIFP
ncbi:unnamed protein product [Microthlaspi erraticum]|uniref:Uncharacterized protein n=1 Tax=Microthlaspi erraticum TaxID=1685480 RepID=A0A6D2HLI1_9BRAS|nr:unnamed protein product [Microthlaspi erraticum]